MYLINGSLFLITSLFLFVVNDIVKDLYYNSNNPLILLLAMVSLFIGFIFYGLEFYKNKAWPTIKCFVSEQAEPIVEQFFCWRVLILNL